MARPDDRGDARRPASAESLYAEFLRLKENAEVDFGEFCSRHPEQRTALEVLHSIHELERSQPDEESVIRRLERHFAAPSDAGGPGATVSVTGSPSDADAPDDPDAAEAISILAREHARRYVEQGEIARGGMGVILRVWDRDLHRMLAKKVIRAPRGSDDSRSSRLRSAQLARFLEEAQVTAQLAHPGVVPVHEVGIDAEDRAYFTMQFVRGRELKEIIRLAREELEDWNLPRALGVLLKACQAVAYAHEHGVLHRDLKPANIMVGDFGEVYVMDWGLAKVVRKLRGTGDDPDDAGPPDDATAPAVRSYRAEKAGETPGSPLATLDGAVVGTPSFMSPEQARGQLAEVDEKSDIYALGAILYYLLSGRMPYIEPGVDSLGAILARIAAGPPRPVHEIESRAPAELVAICEKAMAHSKADRYASCLDLAEDLQAYLDQRVVQAYETGAVAEFKKWFARNRGMATAATAAVVSLVVGLLAVALISEYSREQILRLSDVKVLQELTDESKKLWPCVPEKVNAMRSWLARAESLASRLPEHRRSLEALRRGFAVGDEGSGREHPLQGTLTRLRGERQALLEDLERPTSSAAVSSERRAEIEKHVASIEESIRRLEATISNERVWKVDDQRLQWQHDTLAQLVAELEEFCRPVASGEDERPGLLAAVRDRLDFAETIRKRSVVDHRDAWGPAMRSIADEEECPSYAGLRLEEQVGLVPLGRDPRSGLWEFGHLQTGELPVRDDDGNLLITEMTGLVFVLIPGGTFRMGAVPDGTDRAGASQVDPKAEADEQPVHEVTLQPFLLSKYEMTQGQWQRFTGRNPSRYGPGTDRGGKRHTRRHPVENVTRMRCENVLFQLGLTLPTEAQWEYAARAGTTTVRWTGDEPASLRGAANLADASLRENYQRDWPVEETIDDGYVFHAPVGVYEPNPFGLHDMLGNVWEWVRDRYGLYHLPLSETSERLVGQGDKGVIRGGGWTNEAFSLRSANRYGYPPTNKDNDLGLRPVFVLRP